MMRAKLQVMSVTPSGEPVTSEHVKMMPVTSKPFDAEGKSEDNDFARWTPCGNVELTINNPNLFGKLPVGKKFYADFTPAED